MNFQVPCPKWATVVGLALALLGASARAETLLFTLTDSNGGTASWLMDSQPVPDWSSTQAFRVYGVGVTYFGQQSVSRQDTVQFGNAIAGGGGGLGSGPQGGFALVKTTGPQIYTGSESAPTIVPGTYVLTSVLARTAGEVYTLTVSPVAACSR